MVTSQIKYKNFTKGSKNTLEGKEMEGKIVDKIEKECELKQNKIINYKNSSSITYGGENNLNKIKNYLYKDCENFYLTRKFDKFNEKI